MKTSKRILMALTSLSIVAFLSATIGWGLSAITGYSFYPLFWMMWGLQFLMYFGYDKYIEKYEIVKYLKEYAAKPYREYSVELPCQYCGKLNKIDMDLTKTEFDCENCKKTNAIHVHFFTSTIMVDK